MVLLSSILISTGHKPSHVSTSLCFFFTWKCLFSWWRHQVETFSALLAFCLGNSLVTSEFPHKGQWRGALMFSLICVWIIGWVNIREAGDLRRHRAHYDVIVMLDQVITYNMNKFFLFSIQETITSKFWDGTDTGGRLNIKMSSYQYRDHHVKDKTVSRPSYL